jgi:hypothetical protein
MNFRECYPDSLSSSVRATIVDKIDVERESGGEILFQ